MDARKIEQVEVDVCTACSGIFLDDGEFEGFTGVDPATGIMRLSRFMNVLAKLNERAVLDELTQVYNRKYFNEVLKNVLESRNPGPVTLVSIDVDHFKTYNTRFGHDGGDAVLRETAKTIQSTLRTSRDDYIFRLGGEEFALLFFGLTHEDSLKAAETVRRIVAATPVTMPDGTVVHLEISLGVAFLRSGDDLESFYKRADELLYQAKDTGRNRTVMEAP